MSIRPTVLVVEDEADQREVVAAFLETAGFSVTQSADALDAMARLRAFAFDALVLDLRLPGGDGMAVLEDALTRYPAIRSIVTTGSGDVADAVTAIKRGAVDFLQKPFRLDDLAQKLRMDVRPASPAVSESARRGFSERSAVFERLVGCSPAMDGVFSTLARVSGMSSTVLIHGETGTGKELIARTIHEHSSRRNGAFVAFNAAAIPEALIETELFGHAKGAFTGAIAARAGRFEVADGGTLFIDEVSSMSLTLQAKLLRALQEREIERVGESTPTRFDARVIAATNVNLQRLVQEGKFREDLFYRLNVVPISLPPLRARSADIGLLAEHFLSRSCQHNGVSPRTLTPEALRALMAYSWPGNIRQLENSIEHAVALSGTQREITVAMLPDEIRQREDVPFTLPDMLAGGLDFASVVSQLERELIRKSLDKTRGNKQRAALLLRMSRTTLIDKIQRLGTDTSLPIVA